jgi:hypothetical protein
MNESNPCSLAGFICAYISVDLGYITGKYITNAQAGSSAISRAGNPTQPSEAVENEAIDSESDSVKLCR